MPLTDTFIKALRHDPSKSAGSKHSDGHGLYLHVKESGKYWRMAYRFAGKQKTLALGVYPTVGLAQARRRRDEAREQLASSIDPSLAKQVQKLALAHAHAQESTFEAVAREFHGVKSGAWSDTYAEKWLRNMSKDLFPHVGRMLLPEIWAAAGFDDTLLRWQMKPEVVNGEKKDIQSRVQTRGGQTGR